MTDPFATLGLRASFDLSTQDVERAYLARAAGSHPDLAGSGGDDADSARLNDARNELLNPEARANALILVLGGPGTREKSLPPGFLVEIMEVREAVDAAQDPAARAHWRAWAMERRAAYERDVGALFRRGGDAGTLSQVRTLLNAWRYIERMIEQLEPSPAPGGGGGGRS